MARLGLMTLGGDCPGLNAVVRAVVKRAVASGHEVLGIENGFVGLLEPSRAHGLRALDAQAVSGILPRGGTILGTSNRCNPFRYPVRDGSTTVEQDLSAFAAERLRAAGIDGLVVVGGDGSVTIARELHKRHGVPFIAVPKTIDNDLVGTDQTFGFDTARSIITDAIDKLHTTAEAHERVMVLEVMGRTAGFLAIEAGIAGGADVILVPEIPYRVEAVVASIRARQERGRSFSIAVVSEGARVQGGGWAIQEEVTPGRGLVRLGGAGKVLADAIADQIELEVRVTVLGHLQRGGGPTPFDRLLATRLGAHAIDLVNDGAWNRLVVMRGPDISDMLVPSEGSFTRTLDPAGQLCNVARQLGISLGE